MSAKLDTRSQFSSCHFCLVEVPVGRNFVPRIFASLYCPLCDQVNSLLAEDPEVLESKSCPLCHIHKPLINANSHCSLLEW